MGAEEDRMEYLDNDVSNEEEVQVSDWQFCVVGRLLTEKSINYQIFCQIMT